MDSAAEQVLSKQLYSVLTGADAGSCSWPGEREAFAYRIIRWEADVPMTEEQREQLQDVIDECMSLAGVIGGAFSADGDVLTLFLCCTRFPARPHRETVLWLCAHMLMEECSLLLEQEGTLFIGDEFEEPADWRDHLAPMHEISEWWTLVSPIDGNEAHNHRSHLQMSIKRRQYTVMGGYISRTLRSEMDMNRKCFGFVPLIIEAIWSQHAELSLRRLTGGLNLNEMTRRPKEALLAWLNALQPVLRACPTATSAEPIERVIAGIRADCSLPYSQANLSHSLGLTPAYFCRLFHEKTGQHFSTFLTMTRMEKAQDLLAEPGSHVLQDISQQCGYPNKSYFCQVFKKYTGMTPGEYEQRVRDGLI